MLTFAKELLIESGFEVVLSTFCRCDYGVKASEAVQKIKRVSQMLLANASLC